jgi:hypothetical protein
MSGRLRRTIGGRRDFQQIEARNEIRGFGAKGN